MNFKQSSYAATEYRYYMLIVIEMSQPSSVPFDVMISVRDVTAACE